MKIHEHQAKEVLSRYGIRVPAGAAAFSPQEAGQAARGAGPWVVKAQIHAGGRGKAGGVKSAASPQAVQDAAKALLGMTLVTPQTGPQGKKVQRVYVEQASTIAREFYLSLLPDRATARIMILGSAEGGTEIEETARRSPEKITRIAIDPALGVRPFHVRRLAQAFALEGAAAKDLGTMLQGMYKALFELDCSQIEINPLCVTKEGALMALDAKMQFDDNALFRHPDIEALRDENEEDPLEREAARYEINYIKLDGDIGCMVNGAGLAMATLDIITLQGGTPANFLDVGGGATRERVAGAFKLILSDPGVKGVLVNIFGGIMRCDAIAEGIVAAAREVALRVPLVVRLEGTNVEQGNKILQESGLPIVHARDMGAAAEKIVSAVKAAVKKGG